MSYWFVGVGCGAQAFSERTLPRLRDADAPWFDGSGSKNNGGPTSFRRRGTSKGGGGGRGVMGLW